MYMIKGVDLSAFQTDIDWDKAHKRIEYAILRSTTQNLKPDSQFYTHAANCKVYGIPYDVYKYMYATNQTEAHEEMQSVIKLLLDVFKDNVKVIYLDVEGDSLRKLGSEKLTNLICYEANMIKEAGFTFGLYTGLSFWNEHNFNHEEVLKLQPIVWAARYPHDNKINSYPIEEDIPVGNLNPNLPNQIGWQYTSKGFIDGIKQKVDLNAFDESILSLHPKEFYELFLNDVFNGESISKALESIGFDGSYEYRKKIAAVNGIFDYKGTAEQNVLMLNLLKAGILIKP